MRLRQQRGMDVTEFLLCLAILGLAVLAVKTAWDNHYSKKTELVKDEWVCVREEKSTTPMPIQNGSFMNLYPLTQTKCVEYRRK